MTRRLRPRLEWRGVARAQREAGHEVTAPTLAELGERAGLGGDGITLQTQIDDLADHLWFEDLAQGVSVTFGVTDRPTPERGGQPPALPACQVTEILDVDEDPAGTARLPGGEPTRRRTKARHRRPLASNRVADKKKARPMSWLIPRIARTRTCRPVREDAGPGCHRENVPPR